MRIGAGILAFMALSGCGAIPEARDETRAGPRSTVSAATLGHQGDRQCLAQLDLAGSRYSPLPDRYFGAGCSTVGSVQLSALGGDVGEFGLSNLGPVACPLANRFAGWARYGVDRAARQILGSQLVRIETMGSYSCRNVAGTGRRSAHSRAEAIDVAAFVLADGRRISVQDGWASRDEDEREFLRVIHRSACKRFGTVLGPDYNAAHRDHLHLEEGTGSFCR